MPLFFSLLVNFPNVQLEISLSLFEHVHHHLLQFFYPSDIDCLVTILRAWFPTWIELLLFRRNPQISSQSSA